LDRVKFDAPLTFTGADFMASRQPREWNYLRCKFPLSFAAFDELDYRPIDVFLDSLAGSISQSP